MISWLDVVIIYSITNQMKLNEHENKNVCPELIMSRTIQPIDGNIFDREIEDDIEYGQQNAKNHLE